MIDEKLRLDYEQTVQYHHNLADIRFRLLALVPISTLAAIVFVEQSMVGPVVFVMGFLGFTVTMGITFYDQRNTQIYDAMQKRAKTLETLLEFVPLDKERMNRGGAFLDRPHRDRRLFGIFLMWHDRALAIIYSSSFSGWSYLIVDGLNQTLWNSAQWWYSDFAGIVVPILVFCLFLRALERFDDPTDVPGALPSGVRDLAYAMGNHTKDGEDSVIDRQDRPTKDPDVLKTG